MITRSLAALESSARACMKSSSAGVPTVAFPSGTAGAVGLAVVGALSIAATTAFSLAFIMQNLSKSS